MKKWCVAINLTIVLWSCVALASPHSPQPDLNNVTESKQSQDQNTEALQSLQITEPPKADSTQKKTTVEKTYFYPYQSSMGPRLGIIFDQEFASQRTAPKYLIGFYYMLPSISAGHTELGADLISNTTGRINATYKWIFNRSEKLRPFVKGGFTNLIQPQNGLANLINYRMYGLRLGLGLEDLLIDPASLRWDIEITVGFAEISANVVFGYSWAW